MRNEPIKNWLGDDGYRCTPITIGNINETFFIDASNGRFVLQKLNPIFAPEVNLDIHALTTHMTSKGVSTPHLVPTRDGRLWQMIEGECWRLLTFVDGKNYSTTENPGLALRCGRIVGIFHAALIDFQHDYHFARLNVHDTKGHFSKLKSAIDAHSESEFASEVRPIADSVFSASQYLQDLGDLPKRNSHGDLKINNLVFGKTADSIIDLDTIGLMPWPIEMADAFRSWCNPAGEDAHVSGFDENLFEGALVAYAKSVSHLWTREETSMLVEALLTIPLELSSRFLRDVLEDCYFGFDRKRFESRSAHNLTRAKSQLSVYCDIKRKRAQIEQIVRRAFA